MAGLFFEHESHYSPDTCSCVIARDESDHTDPTRHWKTSVFVTQCDAHAQAGSTAAEVHQHNMSKNVAKTAFLAAVSDEAYAPTFNPGAVPIPIKDLDGNVISWQFSNDDVLEKRLIEEPTFILDPKAGQIYINHPHLTDSILTSMRDAIDAHPYAILSVPDKATIDAAFTAKDILDPSTVNLEI